MGGPKRPTGAELLRRMEAWGDEWRAVAGSTEPSDRPRAEAAIRSLYRASGRPEPLVTWVPSPAAGILAYTFASLGREAIRSMWARGDIGNGANQEFNALADPFAIEPAWARRLATHVVEQLPPQRRQAPPAPVSRGRSAPPWRPPAREPVDVAREALGLGGAAPILAVVRSVAGAGSLREGQLAGGAATSRSDDSLLAAGASILGETWDRLVGWFGADLAGGVVAEATRRLVAEILVDPSRRRATLQAMQPGQWDDVTPMLAAARDVFGGFLWRHRAGRDEREPLVEARLELARSAGPWWALDGLAIVSERPLVLHLDDRARPHRADAPAIAWPDGLVAYAWHGVVVEPWVIIDPGRITVDAIDRETNVEVRRVLVERFGGERLVREGGATLVHEDETGRLWRRDLQRRPEWASQWWTPNDEPVVAVEVVNATPEPDGSRKTYLLRVPPTMTTAREAVAWTFGLGAVEYRPAVES